jgi:pimeloyl-ACP methyl ester carboxylesterase
MGTTTYYYKNKTSTQTHGLTEIYPTITPKMVLIIGHGLGERNTGDITGCKKSSGWGGWANIKAAADVYGIIQIYINTTNNYEFGEYQFALSWAKKKYSTLGLNNKIWVLGHSLGSYGAGRYAFKDTTFCQGVAGWIMSASGDFTPFALTGGNLWQNLVTYQVKVWGVTATNDTVSGTTPAPITEMYSEVKALDAGAHVMKTVFPNTEWTAASSHNQVLNRITGRPLYYSGGNWKLITTGLLTVNNIQMNLYQWMLSNPRTSTYQDPTQAYIGAQYPTPPASASIEIKDYNITAGGVVLLTWTDNTSEYLRPLSGDSVDNIYIRKDSLKRLLITVDYAIAPTVTKGPLKT